MIPESISKICSYASNRDEVGAKILNDRYINLYEMLFFESNPIPVKWMLNKMGFIKNSLRLPLIELDKKYHESISAEMLKLGLI